MRFIGLLSYIFMVMFVSLSAQAQTQHLTGLEIEDLFKKTEELYTKTELDVDEIIRLTKRHTVEGAIFKREMKSNKGERIIIIMRTREEALADIKAKSGRLFDVSLRRTITDIKYAEDKISATVEYTALFISMAKLSEQVKQKPEYAGMDVLPIKSLSTCSEKFKLIDDILKSLGADCKTEVIYGKARAIK